MLVMVQAGRDVIFDALEKHFIIIVAPVLNTNVEEGESRSELSEVCLLGSLIYSCSCPECSVSNQFHGG